MCRGVIVPEEFGALILRIRERERERERERYGVLFFSKLETLQQRSRHERVLTTAVCFKQRRQKKETFSRYGISVSTLLFLPMKF